MKTKTKKKCTAAIIPLCSHPAHNAPKKCDSWLPAELAHQMIHPDEHVRQKAEEVAQRIAQDIYDNAFASRICAHLCNMSGLLDDLFEELYDETNVDLARCLQKSKEDIETLAEHAANKLYKHIARTAITIAIYKYADSRSVMYQCNYNTVVTLIRSAARSACNWDWATICVDTWLLLKATEKPPSWRRLEYMLMENEGAAWMSVEVLEGFSRAPVPRWFVEAKRRAVRLDPILFAPAPISGASRPN